MRIITELNPDVQVLTEESDGKKSVYIEGVYMMAGIVNRNRRRYPLEVLSNEVDRYVRESVNTNRAYGELGHPDKPAINLDRVSHMVKSLRREGNDFIGRSKLIDTPMGNIAKNLVAEGASLGVSSRGLGSLKEVAGGVMEVQADFRLAAAADIVADPSAPAAYVNGILEGTEWEWSEEKKDWVQEYRESERARLRKLSPSQLRESMLQTWNKLLAEISQG